MGCVTSSRAVAYNSVISSMASSAADFVDSQRAKLLACEALLICSGAATRLPGRDSVANGLDADTKGFDLTARAAALEIAVRDSIFVLFLVAVY